MEVLAFLRLHQRFHLQGLQSEGVSPTTSQALPWIRERSPLMDRLVGIEPHTTESAIHHRCVPGVQDYMQWEVCGEGEDDWIFV